MNKRSRLYFLITAGVFILLSILLVGCFSRPADFKKMVPEKTNLQNKHKATVHVLTEGGKGTSALFGRSQISNEGLKLAIVSSIKKYGLFKKVVKIADSDYLLTVKLLALDQPTMGFNLTVRMSTNWILTDKSGKEIWKDSIVSSYEAKFGEALMGTTRMARANEGAARASIQEGLEKISKLNLGGAK